MVAATVVVGLGEDDCHAQGPQTFRMVGNPMRQAPGQGPGDQKAKRQAQSPKFPSTRRSGFPDSPISILTAHRIPSPIIGTYPQLNGHLRSIRRRRYQELGIEQPKTLRGARCCKTTNPKRSWVLKNPKPQKDFYVDKS